MARDCSADGWNVHACATGRHSLRSRWSPVFALDAWPHSGCSKRRRNRVDPYIRTKSTEIRMLRHLLTLCRCNLKVLLEIEFDYLLEFFEKFLLMDSFDIISIVNLSNIFFDLIIMIFFYQLIEDWSGCEK